jgi:hypothetical protein
VRNSWPADIAEVHLAHHQRHDVAGDDADKHRRDGREPAREELDQKRDNNNHQCRNPHRQAAEFRLAHQRHAAGGILDADLDQRQADHQHDQSGHQRRQGIADTADEEAEAEVKHAADHHARHKAGETGGAETRDRRDHHRNKGEAGALHDWQPRPDRAHADGLQQGCDTGEQHRHLDHVVMSGKPSAP